MSMIYNIDDVVYDDILGYPYDHGCLLDEDEPLNDVHQDEEVNEQSDERYPPPPNIIFQEVEELNLGDEVEQEHQEVDRYRVQADLRFYDTPPASDDEEDDEDVPDIVQNDPDNAFFGA